MTDHPNRSAGIESAGFSDIEAAQAIASIANECCYRSDGWEEHIAEEGLKIIRSIRGTPTPAQPTRMNGGDWAQLLTLRDVMKAAYSKGGDRLMSVWEHDLNAVEAAIAILQSASQPSPAATVERREDETGEEYELRVGRVGRPQCSAATGDEPDSRLPLQYEDGPDYCTVKDAQGRDFALTMQPELMRAMEQAKAANKPAIDPKKIAAIDDFLADGQRDKGYRAFAMMRHIWPQLRELALASSQPDETLHRLPFHDETMAGLASLTIRKEIQK